MCMHKYARLGKSGGMLPEETRCSVIASEAILGQKQRLSTYAYAKPTDFEFPREKVLSEQQVGWHH